MRKLIFKTLSLMLAMVFLGTQTFANQYRLVSVGAEMETDCVVSFDDQEIYNAFDEISPLVDYLAVNSSAGYAEAMAADALMVESVSAATAIAMNNAMADGYPPLFSAFIWGCLLNLVGMLIVGVTTGFDSSQMRKSFWGCLLNSLLFGGVSITTY